MSHQSGTNGMPVRHDNLEMCRGILGAEISRDAILAGFLVLRLYKVAGDVHNLKGRGTDPPTAGWSAGLNRGRKLWPN